MTVYYQDETLTLLLGDAAEQIRTLPAGSVNCVVTSPPYYGLRDYEGNPGQIGLEASPAEYVAALVEVFDEVRRVLAEDGTAWLNLGDSYAYPPGSSGRQGNGQRKGRTFTAEGLRGTRALPAKNLLGIPWRVAQAMQEPRYTGDIGPEADRAWLASMIDAEGCVAIHRRMDDRRTRPTFAPMVQVSNTCLGIVERCIEITGRGSISASDRGRNRRIYRWHLMSNDARRVLREVYPHLIAKVRQSRAAIASPSSGPDAERAWLQIKALNRGGDNDGGWPEPASMFQPGWILRNAIVWWKPNAMPESVRDRLSTRYELLFLLTKNARYWFDLDSIRESAGEKAISRGRKWGDRKEAGEPVRYGLAGLAGVQSSDLAPNEKGRNPGDLWSIPTSPLPEAHFAAFPPELPRRCILAGCKPSGTVLDPFSGAGTTALAAQQLGRRAIGIDINAAYHDIALRRMANAPLPFEPGGVA